MVRHEELFRIGKYMVVFFPDSIWGPCVEIREKLTWGPIYECWKITGGSLSKFWAMFGFDYDGWPHARTVKDAAIEAQKWIEKQLIKDSQHENWINKSVEEAKGVVSEN